VRRANKHFIFICRLSINPWSLKLLELEGAVQIFISMALPKYTGADKFLARPGRKQATATEDFDVHISH